MNEQEKNCIFCKIVSKEIPSYIVYEDKKFMAFLEISPAVKGHTLLITKEHHSWIHETPDELLGEFFITAKKVINSMIKGLNCHHIELVIDGVKMSHFHAHLIPRWLNDGLPEFKTIEYDSDEEKQEFALKIKNAQ